jgi:hypothetical protein
MTKSSELFVFSTETGVIMANLRNPERGERRQMSS